MFVQELQLLDAELRMVLGRHTATELRMVMELHTVMELRMAAMELPQEHDP